jgi:hypothetical protein
LRSVRFARPPVLALSLPVALGCDQTRNRAAKSEATRCEAAPPAKPSPRAGAAGPQSGPGPRLFLRSCAARIESKASPGTTGFDAVGSAGMVASRGSGRPRKTPGKQ